MRSSQRRRRSPRKRLLRLLRPNVAAPSAVAMAAWRPKARCSTENYDLPLVNMRPLRHNQPRALSRHCCDIDARFSRTVGSRGLESESAAERALKVITLARGMPCRCVYAAGGARAPHHVCRHFVRGEVSRCHGHRDSRTWGAATTTNSACALSWAMADELVLFKCCCGLLFCWFVLFRPCLWGGS